MYGTLERACSVCRCGVNAWSESSAKRMAPSPPPHSGAARESSCLRADGRWSAGSSRARSRAVCRARSIGPYDHGQLDGRQRFRLAPPRLRTAEGWAEMELSRRRVVVGSTARAGSDAIVPRAAEIRVPPPLPAVTCVRACVPAFAGDEPRGAGCSVTERFATYDSC